ncbi:MAG: Tol-Pal system beta propeller repeat protein TolB [candidate division WOR-3 bacterium]
MRIFSDCSGYKIFAILLLSSTIGLNQLFSQQEIWAKITAGGIRQRIKLGIENFKVPAGQAELVLGHVSELQKIITDDLVFSLYFEIIHLDSLALAHLQGKSNLSLRKWLEAGAQVLLWGEVEIKKKTTIKISLFDTYRQKLIATKSYEIQPNIRQLAHKIADDIIKILTGEDGINQTYIVFSKRRGTAKELAIVDYDGYNLTDLTDSKNLNLFPEFSPHGDKIVYSSYENNNVNIFLYDFKKHSGEVIFNQPGLNTTPAFSPDGKQIAFSASFDGNSELYLIDLTKKNLTRLTYSPAIEISPSFSPSGQELAFVSDRTGMPQIYIMNIDGTNIRRLTWEGSYNTSPAWSPNGDLIAYVSRVGNSNQIFVTDPSGTNYVQLTYIGNNEEPSWSPDGLHIVFSSNRTGTYELFQMHWDGTNQRQITNCGGAYSPSWSPRIKK